MRNSRIISIAAGMTMAGTIAATFLGLFPVPPRPDWRTHQAVGRALAGQTLALLKDGGEVVVITRDTTDFPQPALEFVMTALRRALRKAGARIADVRALEVDPLRLPEVPSGDFIELIRKAPPGSVIISLMGPPLIPEDQRQRLGEIKPRIVAFCPGNLPAQIDLRRIFQQRLLDVAIVSRRDQPRRPTRTRDLATRYQDRFVTVTATNVGGLYPANADSGSE